MYTKLQIEIAKKTNKLNDLYAQRVSELIRTKYSVDAELSIHRQRDTKPEEFTEYNEFAESCKSQAKKELGLY